MENYIYEKIYCECVNKSLTVEHYFPVKDFLYGLVGFYNKRTIDEKAFLQCVSIFFRDKCFCGSYGTSPQGLFTFYAIF